MARISVKGGFPLDMTAFNFSSLYDGASYTTTSSLYRVKYWSGYGDEFRGSGFRYDSYGEPIGGTVKSYAVLYGSSRVAVLDGVKISATSIVKAAGTYGTSDDKKIISKALAGHDVITGGSGNDVLLAYAGNDKISAGRGSDKVYGGAGNDKIAGGLGADKLFGGSGKDTFVFKSFKDSTLSPSSQDTVYDFSHKQGDKIDLKAIDANLDRGGNQAFKFIKTSEFHEKAGELRYEKKGGDTYVLGDVNGDGFADLAIRFDAKIDFVKGDFIL